MGGGADRKVGKRSRMRREGERERREREERWPRRKIMRLEMSVCVITALFVSTSLVN